MTSYIFVTYKNAVRQNSCHIHNTASDMDMAKMCTFPSAHHALTCCKYLLCCCEKYKSIVIPG